jgi:predicted RND superfamily exporter protein
MINWLIRNRVLLFTGVTLLTLFLIGCISLLRLDFRFDGFFPREDPEYQYYEEYQDLFFEAQNYMIAVALESPGDDIFNRPFLEQADSLFYRIQQIPGIDSASLGTRFPYLRRRGMSYRERPFLDWDSEKDLAASRERVSEDSLFKGAFASRNLTYLCSYFFIDPAIFDSPERDRVSRDIDEVLEQTELKSQVTGIPYIRTQYIDKLGAELLLFLTLAAVLLLTSLLWLYRTFWGVVVPLLTAVGALGVTLGLMGLTGEPLTILSNLLIPIMFVVAMSDVIHLLTKFMSRVKDGMNRKEALQVTLKQIGLATFLTSLTTAIGFGALTVSRIGPIRSFGLYAAIGVLATFVVAVAILAFALLKLRPEQFSRPNSFSNSTFWDRNLRKLYVLIFRRPRAVALGVGLLILVSFLLMFRIPFDNYLIQDMSKKDPVRIAMHFFEDEMYGIRSFELGIHARPGQQVDDLEVLQQMEKIEDFLAQTGYFSPFFSPASFIKNANYLYHFNREKHRELPDSQEEVDELFNFASLNGADPILSRLMNEDRSRARINSRIPDIGTEAFQQMREQLNAFIATETDTTVYKHHLTGPCLPDRAKSYLPERQSITGAIDRFYPGRRDHGTAV